MASRLVTDIASNTYTWGGDFIHVTPEVNQMEQFDYEAFRLRASLQSSFLSALKKGVVIAASNTFVVQSIKFGAFKDDYYYRIHVSPTLIDFQTVAASQSRQVSVWNAFPDTSAIMGSIDIERPQGLTVSGPQPPLSISPLAELTYNVIVGVSGPPSINSEILFNFDNVEDPDSVRVIGTRAIKFDIVPESPVTEQWEWLTDVIPAVDNTEQRISLRGEVPRIVQQGKFIFLNSTEIRKFYGDLAGASGRLWMPLYQYATRLTAPTPANTNVIYFDIARTDIRLGEYVLIKQGETSILAQVASMLSNGATLTNPVTMALNVGSIVCCGAPAIIDDGARLKRVAVDEVAEIDLNARIYFGRRSLQRPNSTATLDTFLSLPILIKRPLANDSVDDAFMTGQQALDNGVGLYDIVSRWGYERVTGERQYKIDRILDPVQMDYWKAFLAHCKGSAKKFFIPTYRSDLVLAEPLTPAINTMTVVGREYAEKVFTMPTHRYIELETAGGIHRATIVSSSVSGDNSFISFSPALPNDVLYTNVKRISYLLACRLASDSVTFKHYGLESILSLSIITAEGV